MWHENVSGRAYRILVIFGELHKIQASSTPCRQLRILAPRIPTTVPMIVGCRLCYPHSLLDAMSDLVDDSGGSSQNIGSPR